MDSVARIYQELRTLIVSGQLPPGARISERAVVARTGGSRTPVRSALHRLHQEGFVASASRVGEQRLIELLQQARSRSAADVCAAVLDAVRSHRGARQDQDDVTVMVVRAL